MKAKIHVKLENGEALEVEQEVFLVDMQGFGLDIFNQTADISVKEILIKPICDTCYAEGWR